MADVYTKVFVGGLAWETTSEMLQEHFCQFGDIVEAAVIKDRHTGRSKGYGFVTFTQEGDAKAAIADQNPMVHGRRANCNLAAFGKKKAKAPRREPHRRGPRSSQNRDGGWNNDMYNGWAMPPQVTYGIPMGYNPVGGGYDPAVQMAGYPQMAFPVMHGAVMMPQRQAAGGFSQQQQPAYICQQPLVFNPQGSPQQLQNGHMTNGPVFYAAPASMPPPNGHIMQVVGQPMLGSEPAMEAVHHREDLNLQPVAANAAEDQVDQVDLELKAQQDVKLELQGSLKLEPKGCEELGGVAADAIGYTAT